MKSMILMKFQKKINKNPDADQYGGYYYMKGKLSQKGLFQFYQKFGFQEMPEIHYDWQIYTTGSLPPYDLIYNMLL